MRFSMTIYDYMKNIIKLKYIFVIFGILLFIIIIYKGCTDNTTYYTDSDNQKNLTIFRDNDSLIYLDYPFYQNDYVGHSSSEFKDRHYSSSLALNFDSKNFKIIELNIYFVNANQEEIPNIICFENSGNATIIKPNELLHNIIISKNLIEIHYIFNDNFNNDIIFMKSFIKYKFNDKEYLFNKTIKLKKCKDRSLMPLLV
jgi:hypothetical protein